MASLADIIAADQAEVLEHDHEAVTVTTDSGAATAYVWWTDDNIDDEGLGPRCEGATAQLPGDIKPGDTVTRSGTDYTVSRVHPDGHGLTTVLLKG